MTSVQITVTVNRRKYKKIVPANQTLLRFLRETIFLNSVKEGCNEGECGACTVLVNGHPVNSCLVLAAEMDGKEVLTTEGLIDNEWLHPLQEALVEAGGVQCGYCTPGMLMSAIALLNLYPHPTRAQIRKEMEGNICRCTGYTRIEDGIVLAVEKLDAIRAEAQRCGEPTPWFPGINDNFNEEWQSGYEVVE